MVCSKARGIQHEALAPVEAIRICFSKRCFCSTKTLPLAFAPVGRKRIELKKSGMEAGAKRKGGRPKQEVKRASATGVRFTKAEFFIVKSKAAKANCKLTEYVRTMAVEGRVIAKFSQEEKEFMRKLTGMANNLNQIAKLAHKERMLSAVLEIEKIRSNIDQLIKRFCK